MVGTLASSLVGAAASDIPWTFDIENHPADDVASSERAMDASCPAFESVAFASAFSQGARLDSVVCMQRVTSGMNLDTNKRPGLWILVR